jgi:hypothetical protein
MSYDYASSAATATRLLAQFGQDVTRRTNTPGAYNPATGAVTLTTADTTRKGCIFDYKGKGEVFIRGNLVIVGDKRLLVDATGGADVTDEWIVDGVTYTCVSVGELNPAGTPVMFEVHARKS